MQSKINVLNLNEERDPHGRLIFRRPPPNKGWLELHTEPVIEPNLAIVDSHHHIWDQDGGYMLEDLLDDTSSGHRIIATVFMQSHWCYRKEGPEAMQPVGEVERVAIVAKAAERSNLPIKVCAGIVGFADMELGDEVAPILEALIEAGNGRFRGIRHATVSDNRITNNLARVLPFDMLQNSKFQRGLAQLQAAGLNFDAWIYHTQIPQLIKVARTFPRLPFILNHIGAPLGVGPYAAMRKEVFKDWCASLKELAKCPNVYIKLGGLGMVVFGFNFHEHLKPPSSQILADEWRPYLEIPIELFGSKRCMFESNFPVDKASSSYLTLWNAFKRITQGASDTDKFWLYSGTATSTYKLSL